MRDLRTRAIACHAHFQVPYSCATPHRPCAPHVDVCDVKEYTQAGRQHARRPHSHGYKDQTDLRVQCKRTERGNALVHCAPLGE
ncbi:hypothetical protein BGK55_20665 [Xanthomonas citri pv. malvacearum]|uniref:Uncharacterized protein n=1 Tax=Xanthomonas campestris pv. malvacearum TaxID=86040 RepID=A0AA44Z0Q1_XANCM|nr:hypothetical protein BGK55_20665 [Xanthomonas citri pv. malvacearum]NMI14214.1 hypothetical protein [Xanthomonas citri]OOW63862.1 hypothetical protein Xths_11175 [Xanthomonas campestris pv. thespesiae]OOW82008.1 hypothetical protein Xlen_08260 [Xanthomonas campestris pv. leeana]ASM99462.1 hypothetical protein APY29_01035 [Xanthomonas citri pv. malvacearum]